MNRSRSDSGKIQDKSIRNKIDYQNSMKQHKSRIERSLLFGYL